MEQKVIKAGNSLAVTIPSLFVKTVGISAGSNVKVALKPETGQINYTFTGARQLSLTSSLKKLTPKR